MKYVQFIVVLCKYFSFKCGLTTYLILRVINIILFKSKYKILSNKFLMTVNYQILNISIIIKLILIN